ncbi:hypothetical protein Taro_043745 [Colocasia esculenta]|uniref:Cation/H+ exchanger domain-containing protein n=1 Tax=Colocasia esculenta TaxID=4460 RepID=A0A843WS67_COLES|nr:hypothetical protein [Colocasia esculenta]
MAVAGGGNGTGAPLICLVVAVTRTLAFLLRPLHQPRVIAKIIGGVLLGPSALGRNKAFLDTIFPKWSLTVMDTLASIGLLFFLFLSARPLFHRPPSPPASVKALFLVFMGIALSIMAFPVLARILAELNLLTTDIGRMAMSAVAVALVGASSPLISLWVLLTGAAFVAFTALAISPFLAWMARRSLQGEPVKEAYICATLGSSSPPASSLMSRPNAEYRSAKAVARKDLEEIQIRANPYGVATTNTIGIHTLFSTFIVGGVVPKDGPFADVLIEKIEDLVSRLLLPLYFVSNSLQTNIATCCCWSKWDWPRPKGRRPKGQ